MSDIAWKRLGLVLLLGSVILAAVGVKMNHDQRERSEEQRRNLAPKDERHPMAGRVASAWEDPRTEDVCHC